jgi:hypothetical protein
VLRKALVPVKKFMRGFKTMVNESSAERETFVRHRRSRAGFVGENVMGVISALDYTVGCVAADPLVPYRSKAALSGQEEREEDGGGMGFKPLRAELLFCNRLESIA